MGVASSELVRAPGAGLTKKDADRLKKRYVTHYALYFKNCDSMKNAFRYNV